MENKYFRKNVVSEEESFENDIPSKKSIEEIYLGKPEDQPSKEKSLGQKIFIYGLAIVLSLALIAIGYWTYFKIIKKPQVQEKPSIALAIDSPSENNDSSAEQNGNKSQEQKAPEEDASKAEKSPAEIEVAVLNGGAASGSAGRVKATLIEKGYEKAQADNAITRNHLGQIVYYVDGFSASAKLLVEAVKEKYPNMEVKEAQSSEEKSADLVVIMGK